MYHKNSIYKLIYYEKLWKCLYNINKFIKIMEDLATNIATIALGPIGLTARAIYEIGKAGYELASDKCSFCKEKHLNLDW